MGKCSYFITFALLLVAMTAQAQKAERDYIRKGNRLFVDSTFVDAEVNYRKALDVNPKSTVSMYNLANTLLAQNKVEEAMQQYVAASKLEKDKEKEKFRLVKQGIFLSSIWDLYCQKLKAAYDAEVDEVREALLFYLRFSTKEVSR